jgi:hypothetical protein
MTTPEMHVDAEIGALLDGTLSPDDAARVQGHIASCLACRRVHDEMRVAFDAIQNLPAFDAPAGVWNAIERELDASQPARRSWRRFAAAAAIIVAAALGSSLALGVYHSSWTIERVAGAPTIGTRAVANGDALGEGEWLETDAASRARLSIGTLGSAEVGPGSRVKLVQAGGAERSLRVERGSINARVWAPPRFFIVETAAATAIDLGCIYTLDVDDRGNGVLFVRSGQVELRGYGRNAIVVAGTIAQMRTGEGPGTPYDSTESQTFRDDLATIDFGTEGERRAALDRVLAESSARSTITLWHLLPRVSTEERALVYDRLATIAAPPRGVNRDAVLRLDSGALHQWRSGLEPRWSTERVRLWKRAWRALWSAGRGQ